MGVDQQSGISVQSIVVSTDALTKRYGVFTALENCTFSVHAGEVFGLLGPNGAGKTTLIRLLLGFLRATSGRATVQGLDCRQQSVDVRRRVSYLPGEARLFRRMKGRELLRFFASMRPGGCYENAMQLARDLDLDVERRVAFMSTGMRQKLALAATISHECDLYILDEPTANLDPNVRQRVMKLVRDKKREGRTVLISSHILSEMEESCDRVVILRDGQLVHTQVLTQLRQRHRIVAQTGGALPAVPEPLTDRVQIIANGPGVTIETDGDLADVMSWLALLPIHDVTIERRGLRSVYEQFHAREEHP